MKYDLFTAVNQVYALLRQFQTELVQLKTILI